MKRQCPAAAVRCQRTIHASAEHTGAARGVSNAPRVIYGAMRHTCNPAQPKMLGLSPRLDASFTKVFPGAQSVLPRHRDSFGRPTRAFI